MQCFRTHLVSNARIGFIKKSFSVLQEMVDVVFWFCPFFIIHYVFWTKKIKLLLFYTEFIIILYFCGLIRSKGAVVSDTKAP